MGLSAAKNKRNYALLGLLLIAFFVYLSSFTNAYTHLDDQVQVVHNPNIKQLNINQLIDIFKSTSVGMYQPISTLFYAFTFALFGLNPTAFHLLSFLFHCINILLVYSIFKKLNFKDFSAFFAAAIFALHPMQVESVAWVSAFSNLCFTAFFLMAFLQYLQFFESKNKYTYISCFILFTLACFAKSAAIVFPVLLIATDWFFFQNRTWKSIIQKIPLLLVSLIFGLITLNSRESAGHLSDLSISFDLIDRFFLICHSILFYPIKFIFPYQLSAFYAYPEISEGLLPITYYLSPLLLIAFAFVCWKYKIHQVIQFGVLFYLIGIALVLQLIPVGNQITTDRYIYLPMLGLLIILGFFLNKVQDKKVKILLLLVPLAFAFLSFERSKIWQNDETIWLDVLSKNPKVAQAHNNLGSYYMQAGKAQKALNHFNIAIREKPYYADAFSNRGSLYAQLEKSDEAMRDFNQALKLRPHADAYFNRANELVKAKDLNSAIADYTASIKLAKSADVYTNRAFAYAQIGKIELATKDLETAIKLDPTYGQAYFLFGMILNTQGQKQAACIKLKKAMTLNHTKAKQAWEQICI